MSTEGTIEQDPLQAQYDGIPVPCYTWRRDDEGFVLERANRAAHEFRPGLERLIGVLATEIHRQRPDIVADLESTLRGREILRREMEFTFEGTGEVRRLDVSYVPVPPDRVMVHADDITALRESEERLRAVITTIESGLITLDLNGLITEANPAACRLLGISKQQLMNDHGWWTTLALRHEDGRPMTPGDADSPGRRAFTEGVAVHDVTMLLTRPDGDVVALSANYRPLRRSADGPIQGLVISLVDLTEARQLHDRLVRQSLHDPLTGLPNRLLFQERLEQALARPVRRPLSVMVIGLDRFRAVNDTHGHAAGDDVLIQVAGRLKQELGASQQLARFGGDEFAVLAELEGEREAAELAQRLATTLEAPIGQLFVTAAIGIAVEEPNRSAADLVQCADAAMHRVKLHGGGAYEVFDRAMGGRLRDRLKLEDGLRRAIEQSELRLHYQPIVDIVRGKIVALEALVRWEHPDHGLLPPARFLPAAEEHGRLISMIGEWVFTQACSELGNWPANIRVSVNVAARELGEAGFVDRIAGTIGAAGIDPERIALEITETMLMQGGESSVDGLKTLAAQGLLVYLDDFGTGYSSLTRLARLPLTGIKLDRGFVARATGDRGRRIIEAALSIGRAADLGVIAEGVETDAQLNLLRECGCRYVQGFLLGRPGPPEQIAALLH